MKARFITELKTYIISLDSFPVITIDKVRDGYKTTVATSKGAWSGSFDTLNQALESVAEFKEFGVDIDLNEGDPDPVEEYDSVAEEEEAVAIDSEYEYDEGLLDDDLTESFYSDDDE